MKKIIFMMAVIFIIGTISAYAKGRSGHFGIFDNVSVRDNVSACYYCDTFPVEDLSSDETASLIAMVQEEKLARDVYNYFYSLYGTRVFASVAKAEQKHMNSVASLISKYSLTNPISDDTAGVFSDAAFQELYNALVAEGSASLSAALQVGINIELLDIADLESGLAFVDNQDISAVYTNIMDGSYHHLEAFTRTLALQ